MSNPRNRTFRNARRIACQALYGLSFIQDGTSDALKQSFALASAGKEETHPGTSDLAWKIASGAYGNLAQLDSAVNRLARNWREDRIGKMERAFLRLALFEMLYLDTPPKVVISETLDMADQFGNGEAKNFLNGVLHAAYKSLQENRVS